MSEPAPPQPEPTDNSLAAEKVRSFPHTPGVYLMKDAPGRVIYVGKAKNLRSRAGSYFLKAAAEDPRTAELVPRDPRHRLPRRRERGRRPADGSPADQGHPAEVQPRPQRRQDVSRTWRSSPARTFPACEFTREPQGPRHEALRAVRQSARAARGDPGACRRSSSSAPARSTSTRTTRAGSGSARACWHSIEQCTAPCNLRISQGGLPQGHPPAAAGSRRQARSRCWTRCARRWPRPPRNCASRRRPGCATRSSCWKRSTSAASSTRTSSPRSFPSTRRKGWPGLQKVLHLAEPPRTIEGVDIAHTGGTETVASAGAVHRRAAVQAGLQAVQDPHGRGRRRLRQHPRGGRRGGSSGCTTRAKRFARHPADRRRQGATQRGAGRLRRARASSRRRSSRWPSARKMIFLPGRATSRCV